MRKLHHEAHEVEASTINNREERNKSSVLEFDLVEKKEKDVRGCMTSPIAFPTW